MTVCQYLVSYDYTRLTSHVVVLYYFEVYILDPNWM